MQKYPKYIFEKVFTTNEYSKDGIYTVRFFKEKREPVQIAVNDYFPCIMNEMQNKFEPIVSCMKMKNKELSKDSLWFLILEKAYAKFRSLHIK